MPNRWSALKRCAEKRVERKLINTVINNKKFVINYVHKILGMPTVLPMRGVSEVCVNPCAVTTNSVDQGTFVSKEFALPDVEVIRSVPRDFLVSIVSVKVRN